MTSPDAPRPLTVGEAAQRASDLWHDPASDDIAVGGAMAVLRATLDAARSASPDPDLDAAWKAAEAALPEGWTLEVGDWRAEPNRPEGVAPFEAVAQPYVRHRDGSDPMVIGRSHEGPAAALLALAARLSETPR